MVDPGIYRHFKGGIYKVIGFAKHSETDEPLVIYEPQYGEKRLVARPVSMFTEEVTRDGVTVKRFERIGPSTDTRANEFLAEAQKFGRSISFDDALKFARDARASSIMAITEDVKATFLRDAEAWLIVAQRALTTPASRPGPPSR